MPSNEIERKKEWKEGKKGGVKKRKALYNFFTGFILCPQTHYFFTYIVTLH